MTSILSISQAQPRNPIVIREAAVVLIKVDVAATRNASERNYIPRKASRYLLSPATFTGYLEWERAGEIVGGLQAKRNLLEIRSVAILRNWIYTAELVFVGNEIDDGTGGAGNESVFRGCDCPITNDCGRSEFCSGGLIDC
jgi:hypothetical protein